MLVRGVVAGRCGRYGIGQAVSGGGRDRVVMPCVDTVIARCVHRDQVEPS
jgi:hypothetical protein